MGIEKDGLESGAGHVGGLFQLFDWTAKSRKKLFSSKSDLPERSKQGKQSHGYLPVTRQHPVDEDENGVALSVKGSSDYSCASSVTDEEGFGTKAPSVVARLMGLDSLPTSNFSEPYSTPYFDTQALQDAHHHRRNIECYHDDQLRYSGNLLQNMEEGPTRNPLESKPQKLLSRPIERFQTERLPPRSAKSIPITHHKLLSPIKNPGFVPTKNAAHIMEAAARIIEPGPQTTAKAKMLILGSSSVPLKVHALREKVPVVGSSSETLKVRDVKHKVEAACKATRPSEVSRKPVESNAAKYLKGQSLTKSWNGSAELSFRASTDTEENKGKSISLAIQAKVNVQKRGQNLSRNRNLFGQREQSEVYSNQPSRSQPNVQKNLHKKPITHNAFGALKQNNQKQNCLVDKEKLPSKPLVSNSQGRKVVSGDSSSGHTKSSIRSSGSSKLGRKLGSEAIDSEKAISYSNARNYPRKKRSIDGNFQFNKDRAVDDMPSDKNQKPVQSNQVTDKHYSWAEDSRKKGIDVVSFTFTAPLARSLPGTEISAQVAQKNNSLCMDHRRNRLLLNPDNMKLSLLGYNVTGGDALSVLLEQKLRQLSYGTESSSHDSMKVGSASAASNLDVKPNFNAVSSMQRLNDQRDQHLLVTEKLGGLYDSDFLSADSPAFRLKQKFQGVNKADEYSTSHIEPGQFLCCQHPSPVSVLEPSVSNESYDSSVSTDSNSTEGSRLCSSIQAQEVHVFSSSMKFHSVEADTELTDSASSTSTGIVARNHAATVYMTETLRSNEWELEYIKETLCNVELMFKDFALGRARGIINPHLFNLLESRRGELENDGGQSRLRRKELFDCTSECLDLRCRRYVGGGYSSWVKGVAMVRRKECLAEEVYKEFSGWRGMVDCRVDEVVDKDMGSPYGQWVDYETDAFALGVEVEGQIFNSLVEEVVAGILQL